MEYTRCVERSSVHAMSSYSTYVINSRQCGFAVTQEAYDANITPLFASLDRLEGILKGKAFLVGDILSEADVRLYTTIVSLALYL